MNQIRQSIEISKLFKLKRININSRLNFLRSIKKSDTAFILGSGASILKITNWSLINDNDSFGFNFFCVNEFIPDFYFIEPSRDEAANSCYLKIINSKPEYFNKTTLFIRKRKYNKPITKLLNRHQIKYRIFKNTSLHTDSKNELYQIITKYHDSYMNNFFHPSQGVASAERIVMLAIRMGYKKIILCGVDLNNTKYFYEDPEYNSLRDNGLVPDSRQQGKVHKTNDKQSCFGRLTVSEVLEVYGKFFQKMGGQIYVENPESALAEIFPVMKL